MTTNNLLFNDEIDNWLYIFKRADLKQSSFDRLERTIKTKISPWFKDYSLNDISPEILQQFLNNLEERGYSYSEIKKNYNAINAFFKHEIQMNRLTSNPASPIRPPSSAKNPPKKTTYFTEKEINLIKTEIKRKYSNNKDVYLYGRAYILMLNTGLRMGELLALNIHSDYDAKANTLSVTKDVVQCNNRNKDFQKIPGYYVLEQKTPKTQSSKREIYLNIEAKEAYEYLLKAYEAIPEGKGYLIRNNKGNVLSPQNFQRTFYRILKNCNIQKTGTHTLRHTFATRLFNAGADIKHVSRLLGHASVKITYDIYVHILERNILYTVNLLDDYIEDDL